MAWACSERSWCRPKARSSADRTTRAGPVSEPGVGLACVDHGEGSSVGVVAMGGIPFFRFGRTMGCSRGEAGTLKSTGSGAGVKISGQLKLPQLKIVPPGTALDSAARIRGDLYALLRSAETTRSIVWTSTWPEVVSDGFHQMETRTVAGSATRPPSFLTVRRFSTPFREVPRWCHCAPPTPWLYWCRRISRAPSARIWTSCRRAMRYLPGQFGAGYTPQAETESAGLRGSGSRRFSGSLVVIGGEPW